MCGIAGFLDARLIGKPEAQSCRAKAMANALWHRGPDGHGHFVDPATGLGLAHRRLAIIDTSPAGAQPMTSADGRWVICYNGEVYNAEDLRRTPALSGVRWRGHSDTEVVLECVAAFGVETALAKLNGMFAIALWDKQANALHLARDRIGIKPLFVARLDEGFAFASELKGLRAIKSFQPEVDPRSVATFLRLGYVSSPNSIYRDVWKVMPGEHWLVDAGGIRSGQVPRRRRYWSMAEAAKAGIGSLSARHDEQDLVETLDTLLRDCVARQMVGDVPVGAFLSGGIDSSAVVAMMVAARKGPVRTFSIGFEEAGFDESSHAAAVAAHLGTDHTELRVSARDALAVVPRLPSMYDEPFADSSQIPTYLLSKLTRQFVTVALSGDGGDELFAGYNRHRLASGLIGKAHAAPQALRRFAATVMSGVPATMLDIAAQMLPRTMQVNRPAEKLRKLADVLPLKESDVYLRLISLNPNLADIVPLVEEHPAPSWTEAGVGGLGRPLDRMQYLDATTYLPDDILQKIDRASMAASLEARPPLLDNRVVDFAWSLPSHMKIRSGESKWILRRVLYRHVPQGLLERPKMGFGIPLGEWLRGPLRAWASDQIAFSQGAVRWCDKAAISSLWQRHLSGPEDLAQALWPVLMLSAWAEANH